MNENSEVDFKNTIFYKLRNKRRLASILRADFKTLKSLLSDDNFKTYTKYRNGKPRNIEDPKTKLKQVHKRIRFLLEKVRPPDWILSGIKKRSYLNNALIHRNSNYYLKADINSFYKSCSKTFVFKFFKEMVLVSEDVAWFIADLLTYKCYLPTGSPSSQLIAFWSYYPTFKRIYELAKQHDVGMTLYVDDFTFSSDKPITGRLAFEINGELKKVGLKLKRRKTGTYNNNDYKVVTGVTITPTHQLKVPNKLGHKIIKCVKDIETSNDEKEIKQKKKSLLGMITSARQIEPHYMEKKYNELIKSPL